MRPWLRGKSDERSKFAITFETGLESRPIQLHYGSSVSAKRILDFYLDWKKSKPHSKEHYYDFQSDFDLLDLRRVIKAESDAGENQLFRKRFHMLPLRISRLHRGLRTLERIPRGTALKERWLEQVWDE